MIWILLALLVLGSGLYLYWEEKRRREREEEERRRREEEERRRKAYARYVRWVCWRYAELQAIVEAFSRVLVDDPDVDSKSVEEVARPYLNLVPAELRKLQSLDSYLKSLPLPSKAELKQLEERYWRVTEGREELIRTLEERFSRTPRGKEISLGRMRSRYSDPILFLCPKCESYSCDPFKPHPSFCYRCSSKVELEPVPILQRRELVLGESDRFKHIYVLGGTGTGKTTFLKRLILQDLRRGEGLGVFSPDDQLFRDDLLPAIPKWRLHELVYFNPEERERPVPFNPLHLDPGEDIDQRVNETLVIFKRAVGDTSPRMDTLLRNTLYALMRREGSTLLDIPVLLSPRDPGLRREILRDPNQDELTKRFFAEIYPTYPKDAHLPLINRLDALIRPLSLRRMLCNPKASFNFRWAIDHKLILLFNLSDRALGEQNSQLLGQLLLSKLQQAVFSRGDVPEAERVPFYLYVDEFQHFIAAASQTFANILARARKFKLGLVFSHQNIDQIGRALFKSILGNVHALVCFRLSYEDARELTHSKELAEEVIRLGVGEAFVRIGPKFYPIRVPYPAPEPQGSAEEAMKASRQRFGVPFQERASGSFAQERGQERGRGQKEEEGQELDEAERVFLRRLVERLGLPTTRLYRELGLSAWKGNKLREALKEKGLIEEVETRLGKGGKRAKLLLPSFAGLKLLGVQLEGRGGALHKALQRILKEEGSAKGYLAACERPLPNGGIVDVHWERGGEKIAVEIAISDPVENEVKHVLQALEAGYSRVYVVFLQERALDEAEAQLKERLPEAERAKVRLLPLKKLSSLL